MLLFFVFLHKTIMKTTIPMQCISIMTGSWLVSLYRYSRKITLEQDGRDRTDQAESMTELRRMCQNGALCEAEAGRKLREAGS